MSDTLKIIIGIVIAAFVIFHAARIYNKYQRPSGMTPEELEYFKRSFKIDHGANPDRKIDHTIAHVEHYGNGRSDVYIVVNGWEPSMRPAIAKLAGKNTYSKPATTHIIDGAVAFTPPDGRGMYHPSVMDHVILQYVVLIDGSVQLYWDPFGTGKY